MKTTRLQAAVNANPESPDLYRNLGNSHFDEGNLGESLSAFLMALVLAPDDADHRRNALKLLGMTGGYQLPPAIRTILASCAADPELDIQALASVIHTEFANGSVADLLIEDLQSPGRAQVRNDIVSGRWDAIFDDELLKAVMVGALLITPTVERLLTGLRRFFLESLEENGRAPDSIMNRKADFIAALACQCFNTEFVFEVSAEEEDLVGRLASDPASTIDIVILSVLGCYRYLHDVAPTVGFNKSDLTPFQVRMVERLIEEPQNERLIAQDIPAIGGIEDATSQAVQAQYQNFPYPRWTSANTGQKPVRFGKYVRQRFPLVRAKQVPEGGIDILVAGCGTGRQVIEVAATYKNAVVTAVDLSRASLAYARARADERELDNISFFQGDILELGCLEGRFDLIECMGVLHHMAQPEAGLAVLRGLLKPAGFLRLALYSTRARPEVRAAAAFIKECGYDGSPESVRKFRHDVYALPQGSEVAEVTLTRDFFSVSGLHDYVFNVQEATYTPLELKELLEEGGLEFLGFDLPSSDVAHGYASVNPADRFMSDLEAWDRFEAEHTETFGLMFQFWCRPGHTGPRHDEH
jgi:SAM-dependent methyltransferase